MKRRCLTGGCSNSRIAAGCCRKCYDSYMYAIRRGYVTRKELEEDGVMLPPAAKKAAKVVEKLRKRKK